MVLLFLVLAISLTDYIRSLPARAQAPDFTPTPSPEPSEGNGMISLIDRLEPPPLPENPTQADYGYQVYYYVCMVCHGDYGQGLTPEWIESWGLDKNACWASHCHAANHPPEGFVLPKTIPGVVGAQVLQRFGSALELHDYIAVAMPWHNPGYLSAEEYWQLTAFLLRANGIDPGREDLNLDTAARIVWRATPTPTSEPTPTPAPIPGAAFFQRPGVGFVIGGVLILGALLVNWVLQRRKKR